MTLLIAFVAAIAATVVWYTNEKARKLGVGLMCYMYWGASLMWLVDAVFGYAEDGADFFVPSAADMINDSYLGLSVVVLGLLVWLVYLLVKDPKNVIKSALTDKK